MIQDQRTKMIQVQKTGSVGYIYISQCLAHKTFRTMSVDTFITQWTTKRSASCIDKIRKKSKICPRTTTLKSSFIRFLIKQFPLSFNMKIRISFNDKWICLHTWEAEWTKTNSDVFNTQNSYILKTVHI